MSNSKKQQYFFILGSNPELSFAEIATVLGIKEKRLISKELLVLETENEIVPENLIKKLGGIIKIGVFQEELDKPSDLDLQLALAKIASKAKGASGEGKFCFGISVYGETISKPLALGLELKKYFREQGLSCRLVTSREPQLSSVVVTQNKLIGKGIELVIAKKDGKVLLGQTLAVQDFKDLSKRDYGRPARDDESGMLPPKLAQIMINLAGQNSLDAVILDPFCGSGTVVTEAMLMGYQNLIGADLSPKAVSDTRENVNWMKKRYGLDRANIKIINRNVINLSKVIKASSVDAVVTEPYLGPQRGLKNVELVIENLEDLYTQALRQFDLILKPGGRVVMIWPVFFGKSHIEPKLGNFTKVYSVLYGREGQRVFREVVVLDKK
ncbi:MAG: DNA methyltransferase [Candidatus Falkowbacteria bacterium]|nr:DNA methyltransferase [Candidatus Falkowbacteria bacterium]